MVDPDYFSNDTKEFLILLAEFKVRYLIVGGEAVIYYGHTRLTGDLDIFYSIDNDNIENLFKSLNKFWNGSIPGINSINDLKEKNSIIQFGLPPNRIDLINSIDGVEFEKAWENRIEDKLEMGGKIYPIFYIGIEDLIENKTITGRNKDIDDLKFLLKKLKTMK